MKVSSWVFGKNYKNSVQPIEAFLYTLDIIMVEVGQIKWLASVKVGRHWSKDVFGQCDSDDQYPKEALIK